MKRTACLRALLLSASVGCADAEPPNEGVEIQTQAATVSTVFSDSFETDKGWGIFEEIVGGSSCYGTGVGEVARIAAAKRAGGFGLSVWSNKAQSLLSNHVIGQKRISPPPADGLFTYSFYARIDGTLAANGQTGPEFSLQNTRERSPGVFRTATAGLQFLPNPWAGPKWQIWTEAAAGSGVAQWQDLPGLPALSANVWYQFILTVNYSTNRYGVLQIKQGKTTVGNKDLSATVIADETKFTEAGFWMSLESENLWNNCGTVGMQQFRVSYDDLSLKRQ